MGGRGLWGNRYAGDEILGEVCGRSGWGAHLEGRVVILHHDAFHVTHDLIDHITHVVILLFEVSQSLLFEQRITFFGMVEISAECLELFDEFPKPLTAFEFRFGCLCLKIGQLLGKVLILLG
jgi:hypothetical protein